MFYLLIYQQFALIFFTIIIGPWSKPLQRQFTYF